MSASRSTNCRCIRFINRGLYFYWFISDEEYLDSTLTTANLRVVNWSPENEKTRTRGSTPSPTTMEAPRMKNRKGKRKVEEMKKDRKTKRD